MRLRFPPFRWALLVLLALVVLLLGFYPPVWMDPTSLHVSAEQARRQRFALILDARTPRDREEEGFYPNSIPVDPATVLDEVPFLLGQRASDTTPRQTPLLVYSQAGDGKAKDIARQLYEKGYHGVRFLTDPYVALLPPGGPSADSDSEDED